MKRKLVDYFYKELDSDQMTIIKEHLKTCHNCKSELEKIEKVINLVNTKARFEPPEEFWNGYVAKVHEKLDKKSYLKRILEKLYWIFVEHPKLIPAITTISLVIGISLCSLYFHHQQELKIAQHLDLLQELEFYENLDFLIYLNEIEF
jgi:hypothetical protein